MLRITQVTKEGGSACLRLEGRIVGPWVGELLRECDAALHWERALCLDMTSVGFLDGEAVQLVRSLALRGIAVRNCSPFVGEQLRGGRHETHGPS